VALRRQDGAEEFIGVGRYICAEDDHRRAEFALAVVDAWQGRGVGTLLMEHLARIAAADGVERFEAEILATNRKMFDVVVALGFRVTKARARASCMPGSRSSPRPRRAGPATSAPGTLPPRACAPCCTRARWRWWAPRAIPPASGPPSWPTSFATGSAA
jgi:hypothetical protein